MRSTITKKPQVTTQRQIRIFLSKAFKGGLLSVLDYEEDESEESEEDSTESDEPEETALEERDQNIANDDEPFEPLDYEWSPWCDDTESVSLREYLEEHLDWQQLRVDEFTPLSEILAKDEAQTRIAIQSLNDLLKSKLNRLVELYDFNYQSVGFSDISTPLPDVSISRTEKTGDGGFDFSITVIDDYSSEIPNTPRNRDIIKLWEDHLRTFTDLLLNAEELNEFFAADSFEQGWNAVKERLPKKSWSQKRIAKEWHNRKAAESPREELSTVKYYEDRISEIVNRRYVELEFFGEICLFKQFFPKKEDIQ